MHMVMRRSRHVVAGHASRGESSRAVGTEIWNHSDILSVTSSIMLMRPVNFTHYTPIIRFLAEWNRDLVLPLAVITRCCFLFAAWWGYGPGERDGWGGTDCFNSLVPRPTLSLRVYTCFAVYSFNSPSFLFFFLFLSLSFFP